MQRSYQHQESHKGTCKYIKVRKEAKWTFMGFKTAGEGSCVAGNSSILSKRQQNVIPSQSSIAMGSQGEVGMRSSQHTIEWSLVGGGCFCGVGWMFLNNDVVVKTSPWMFLC